MVYLVRVSRLKRELSSHAKGKGKGVLNWFINSEDGMVYFFYDVFNVTYCSIVKPENVPVELKLYMGADREILGLYEKKEKEARKISVEPLQDLQVTI